MSVLVQTSGLALPGRLNETMIELHAGEVACLIGPNGSGKTSLLHALAGIGSPAGSVSIAKSTLRNIPPTLRPSFLSFMPASRDVRWPLRSRALIALGGAGEGQIEHRIDQLGLADLADRTVDRLSTGERSRVLLARALASEPQLLLLDEPLANLDPQWQLRLIELLRREIQGTARAALVAVHDLDSAAKLANRLIVMSGGRIVADGLPQEVLAGSAIPQVFGVEPASGSWRLVTEPADPRSSP